MEEQVAFPFAVKKDYFRNIKDAKYQVFRVDLEKLTVIFDKTGAVIVGDMAGISSMAGCSLSAAG